MDCSTPGFSVYHWFPELAQAHVHRIRDAIQPSHPLSFPSHLAFNLSQHQGFYNESVHIRWSKYWSFSFSISSSNEYLELIFFRIDRISSLSKRLSSLCLHHNLKASVLWCSAFFMVQLSHPYKTPRKNIVLTIWTFVGKVIALIFNTLLGFS